MESNHVRCWTQTRDWREIVEDQKSKQKNKGNDWNYYKYDSY